VAVCFLQLSQSEMGVESAPVYLLADSFCPNVTTTFGEFAAVRANCARSLKPAFCNH
jgi:hypothetical protein